MNFLTSHFEVFAAHTSKLTTLLKKDATFQWNSECKTRVSKFQMMVTSVPISMQFTTNEIPYVYLDTFYFRIGVSILQMGSDDHLTFSSCLLLLPLSRQKENYPRLTPTSVHIYCFADHSYLYCPPPSSQVIVLPHTHLLCVLNLTCISFNLSPMDHEIIHESFNTLALFLPLVHLHCRRLSAPE